MNDEEVKVEANSTQSVDSNLAQTAEKEQSKPQETQEDPNWRAFREGRKKDRIEKEAAERRAQEKQAEIDALKAAMEAAFSKNNPPQYRDNDVSDETEDERIEKKVREQIAKREAEFIQQQQEREIREYPEKLRKNYSDFNQTISEQNLDYLEYHYPEIAGPLKRLPDGYEKWADIYKAVKRFVPNNSNAQKEAEKASLNMSKPKSISSPSMTDTGKPTTNMLTEERKAENWARMQKLLKSMS